MDSLWIISQLKLYTFVFLSSILIIPSGTVEPHIVQKSLRPSQVALSTSKFAIALYKEISKASKNDNIFISPLSVSTALGMLLAGANGATANEIKSGLYFGRKQLNLHPTLGHLISILNQTTNDSTVHLANRLFIQKQVNVKPLYSNNVQLFYKSKIGHVDFKNTVHTKTKINEWVSEQTCGQIPKILDGLDQSIILMIVNAIYFKANWDKHFNQTDNTTSVFYSTPREEINVEMMSRTDEFNFVENSRLECKVIELPYSDNQYSMFILLPDKTHGIRKLENKLSVKIIKKIIKNMRIQQVTVLLPKFKIQEKYSMPEILTKIGISSVFSVYADLSGIFENTEVYVSDMIHQAFIDVNERGTEATGANVISIKPRMFTVPISFNADHPFFFLIRHNPTDLIVFTGKVQKPN